MSGDKSSVIRPSVPPVAWAAVGVWIGVLAAEGLSWRAYMGSTSFSPLGPVCGAALLGAILLVLPRGGILRLVLIGLATGTCVGVLFWADWHADVEALPQASRRWLAESSSDPRDGPYGAVSEIQVRDERGANWSCTWAQSTRTPEAGELVEFFGAPKSPKKDEWGRRLHQQGISARLTARHELVRGAATSLRGVVLPWRQRVGEALRAVDGPGGDLLCGVVLGDRRRLQGTDTEADFRITGLSHLIAVSGGHLVVVAALTTWALVRLGASRKLVLATVCIALGAYVLASGVQPSALRAWLMACVASAAGLGGRRADGVAALSVAVCIALLSWPPAAFELGLRLSAAAVAGLLVFGRLAEGWVLSALPRSIRGLSGPVAVTLTAQAATLPLTAPAFGMVSLISPLANLLAAPCISAALGMGLVGSLTSLFSVSAGRPVLQVAGIIGAIAARVASTLGTWRYAAVPLGIDAGLASWALVGGATVTWVIWPTPSVRIARVMAAIGVAIGVLLLIRPMSVSGPELVVMDVGQGDAILVRDGSRAILVDAGPSVSALRAALLRMRIRRIDAVVLTHLHDDHIGGLAALERVIPVGQIVVPAGALELHPDILEDARRVSEIVSEVSAGDTLTIGSTSVRVLWPDSAVDDAAANEASVVVAVESSGFSAVLTGDAEHMELERVVAAGRVGDIDVLKVGHHGSADAISEVSLGALHPEYALISVGRGNRFGHPVASTVSLLGRYGARVLRTDRLGDLTVRWESQGYSVESARVGE